MIPAEILIARLKRLQAVEIQSARLLGGWLPGIVGWEIKHQVGIHLWQDATHSKELRTRLWELRTPNPDRGLDEGLGELIRGLAAAQEDYEFLAGLYLVLKTELVVAYRAVAENTHRVYDAPTVALIARLLPEKEAQVAWAEREVAALSASGEKQRQVARWLQYARDLLAATGGIFGEGRPAGADGSVTPPPGYGLARLPFPQAVRDSRFKLVLGGMALPAENDRDAQVLFQFFNYSQEMQAAETLGSLLWECEGMEWEFYYDLARHCYDEVRHSALGQSRLRELGHHVTDFPNTVVNYAWRQLVDPLRRYCVLTYVIEADAFKYKHSTYQQHLQAGDLESAQAVLFDITDETMHVRFGQKWVPALIKRYGYDGALEQLVDECRQILIKNTVNPLQRQAAAEAGQRRY